MDQTVVNWSVVTVREDQAVADAAQLMKETEIGCVLVVDGGGVLTGILTGRDLVLKVMAASRSMTTKVKEVMTGAPIAMKAHDRMDAIELARKMGRVRVRRVPIVDDDGRPVGIVSLEDIVVYSGEVMAALADALAPSLTYGRLRAQSHGRQRPTGAHPRPGVPE